MAHTFFAATVANGIDVYLDRIWVDSVGRIAGELFRAPADGSWYEMFIYAISLTLLALFAKWVISTIADWFDPEVKPTKSELEMVKAVRRHNAAKESTPI